MLSKFLLGLRNLIWDLRRRWKKDPLEKPGRPPFDCDLIWYDSLDGLRNRLIENGFELQHILQYEHPGQILSCRYVYDNGRRQHHIRFFYDKNGAIEVFAHDEWVPEKFPIKHIRGETLNNSSCAWFYKKIYKINIEWELQFYDKRRNDINGNEEEN